MSAAPLLPLPALTCPGRGQWTPHVLSRVKALDREVVRAAAGVGFGQLEQQLHGVSLLGARLHGRFDVFGGLAVDEWLAE